MHLFIYNNILTKSKGHICTFDTIDVYKATRNSSDMPVGMSKAEQESKLESVSFRYTKISGENQNILKCALFDRELSIERRHSSQKMHVPWSHILQNENRATYQAIINSACILHRTDMVSTSNGFTTSLELTSSVRTSSYILFTIQSRIYPSACHLPLFLKSTTCTGFTYKATNAPTENINKYYLIRSI